MRVCMVVFSQTEVTLELGEAGHLFEHANRAVLCLRAQTGVDINFNSVSFCIPLSFSAITFTIDVLCKSRLLNKPPGRMSSVSDPLFSVSHWPVPSYRTYV